MGTSEVGHLALGIGRISKQPLVEVDDLFAEGKFVHLPAFQQGIEHVRKNQTSLHLIGLLSVGGVHTTLYHLQELIKLIPNDIQTFLHLFSDGRDMPPHSA